MVEEELGVNIPVCSRLQLISHTQPYVLFFFSQSYLTICCCGTIRSTFAELFPTLYSIRAKRQGLRVNYAEVGLMTAVRLLFLKKHNLAEAQNHTLCMSILVLYPHLSQGEWVAPLVHSLVKLESMVAGGA